MAVDAEAALHRLHKQTKEELVAAKDQYHNIPLDPNNLHQLSYEQGRIHALEELLLEIDRQIKRKEESFDND